MRVLIVFALCLLTVAADPIPERIVGGALITVNQHPSVAAVLFTWDLRTYLHVCGGAILNARSIITAAQCLDNGDPADRWRIRVGSNFANSGGTVHTVSNYIVHSAYNFRTLINDLAIMRTTIPIVLTGVARAATLPAANFNIANNLAVWAAGWGATSNGGQPSEQLRRAELRVIAHATCINNYATVGKVVNWNMVCGGWTAGGRGPCVGDTGGPLYNGVALLIGIFSFSERCGLANFPGVHTRIPNYIAWILANA